MNPAFLGQVPLRTPAQNGSVELDRASAQYGDTVIHLLRSLPESDLEVVATACWRELMLVNRDQVNRLSTRLVAFLDSDAVTLPLPPAEYQVFDRVLACGHEIEECEDTEQGEGIQHVAAVIGILGGLAALIALA